MVEEKIYHDAGATTSQNLRRGELLRLIREAGREPVERDTLYRPVERVGERVHGPGLIQSMRRDLDVLNRTPEMIVLRERPHPVVSALFVGFALLMLVAPFMNPQVLRRPMELVGLAASVLFFSGLAVFWGVQSTLTVNLAAGTLRVRDVANVHRETIYPISDIEQVFVRKRAWLKRELHLQLASRKKKRLTLFSDYSSLPEQATMLNGFMRKTT